MLFKKIISKKRDKGPTSKDARSSGAKTKQCRISPDLIPLILAHLDVHELAICLRVNQTFFDLAASLLYGKEMSFGFSTKGSTIFAGIITRRRGFSGREAVISKTKSASLSHIRHLDYYGHRKSICKHLQGAINLLPNLETLVFHVEPAFNRYHWDCPVLSGLRPRNIQIRGLRAIQEHVHTIPLDELFGHSATSVSLQAYECLLRTYRIGHPVLSISWPRAMTHLEIICRRESSWTAAPYTAQSEEVAWYPFILSTEIDEAVDSLLRLLLSAEHLRAKVRVEGYGRRFSGYGEPVDSEMLREKFGANLINGYTQGLRDRGLTAEDAETRVRELDF